MYVGRCLLMIQKKRPADRTHLVNSYFDAYAGLAVFATLACCGFAFFTGLGLADLVAVDALAAAAAFICARFLAL
jgi:hypothetical protein